MSDQLREAIERAAKVIGSESPDLARGMPWVQANRRIVEVITAELTPLLEKQAARVRELEGLLREARNDLHYAIRVATSDSSTDEEFTKYARRLFASEIETIEKIDAALAGTNKGGTDG